MITGPLHIACAADENFLPHCAAMLHSAATWSEGRPLHVYFMAQAGFPADQGARLEAFVRGFGGQITCLTIGAQQLQGFPPNARYGLEAWMRLVLPDLLPEVPRLLYLDADLIVNAPLPELHDVDLQGLPLAAVPCAQLPEFRDWPQTLGLPEDARYFNSGVLVMDLHAMRQQQLVPEFRRYASQYAKRVRFPDQDVLNLVFHRRYLQLPLRWNVISNVFTHSRSNLEYHGREAYLDAVRNPGILHFAGWPTQKPWHYRCTHPYRGRYVHHRLRTPWPRIAWEGYSLRNAILRRVPSRLLASFQSFFASLRAGFWKSGS